MKGRQILLDHMNDRQAAALVEDGKLQDLFLETDLPAPGTVYRAVADRPVKGLPSSPSAPPQRYSSLIKFP